MDKNDNSKLKKLKVFFIGSQETGYEALESLIGSNVSIVGCFSLKPAQHETWEKDVSSLAQKNEISVWEFEDHLTQSKNPNKPTIINTSQTRTNLLNHNTNRDKMKRYERQMIGKPPSVIKMED